MPGPRVRLLALSVVLAVSTVVLAGWAVHAYRYASTVGRWPYANGTVVAQPQGKAAVQFADTAGTLHLMPLKTGDTDDLPVGSSVRISYHLTGDTLRSEFRTQPGARASALTVLAMLAALGVGVTWWRAGQERPTTVAAAH